MCEREEPEVVDPFLEIMAVRKPTKIKRIIDSVPRPPRSRPPRPGFPQWDILPLYYNLSLPNRMPKEVTIYSRDKLGEKLWKGFGYAEYFLKDPYCYEIQFFPYESRHDPHLKHHFNIPAVRELLYRNGFIKKDGNVLCTLPQYNAFRRFLYRTQAFHIHNAIWWHDAMEFEKMQMQRFNWYLQRDIERDERREFFREVCSKVRAERLAAEEQAQKQREKIRQAREKRAQASVLRRLKKVLAVKERTRAMQLQVHLRLQEKQRIKRKIILRTLRRLHDSAIEVAFRRNMLCQQKEDSREVQACARYRCKVYSQLRRFHREAQLLEWDRERFQEALVLRDRIVEIEQRRMADLLEQIQVAHLKEMKAKKAQKKKEKYIEAVTKAWGKETFSPYMVEQAVIAALAANKSPTGGHEVLSTLRDIKEKLDISSQLPEAVVYVVDALLENVIKEFISKNLCRVLEDVQVQIVDKVNELASAARGRRRSDALQQRRGGSAGDEGTRRASLSSVGSGRRGSGAGQGRALVAAVGVVADAVAEAVGPRRGSQSDGPGRRDSASSVGRAGPAGAGSAARRAPGTAPWQRLIRGKARGRRGRRGRRAAAVLAEDTWRRCVRHVRHVDHRRHHPVHQPAPALPRQRHQKEFILSFSNQLWRNCNHWKVCSYKRSITY